MRGDFELRTQSGEVIDGGRGTVALCRCGLSAIKPLCDGTHKVGGFHASGGDRER
ncbi:iron-binding CDGSH zinc finger protein [Umezawaea tangerina]|uniref:Iron-binding CDGSH zinc finger protein n=1 Tax=Umezawaea tangerina TaxID=84725 RepID=A0A2T0SYZ7_9PSEU|nr:iron-binding CDGSH zinc finger protein [Umezawaea tangerina]